MALETLKPVPGFPGYFANARGHVVSTKQGYARTLGGWPDKDGYLKCNLWVDGKEKVCRTHVLVCTAWCGVRPSDAHEVRHLNGNRQDNRPGNLKWGTKKQNARDRERHGTTAKGERNKGGGNKLTLPLVRSIKRELRHGNTHRELADLYDVSRGMIGHIAAGRKWAHA